MALFCFVGLRIPKAFTGIGPLQDTLAVAGQLIYFSFVTLTSVGYGDIVPLHPFARGSTNVEAIIGQLYPATLLARLVTLELEDRRALRPGRTNVRFGSEIPNAAIISKMTSTSTADVLRYIVLSEALGQRLTSGPPVQP